MLNNNKSVYRRDRLNVGSCISYFSAVLDKLIDIMPKDLCYIIFDYTEFNPEFFHEHKESCATIKLPPNSEYMKYIRTRLSDTIFIEDCENEMVVIIESFPSYSDGSWSGLIQPCIDRLVNRFYIRLLFIGALVFWENIICNPFIISASSMRFPFVLIGNIGPAKETITSALILDPDTKSEIQIMAALLFERYGTGTLRDIIVEYGNLYNATITFKSIKYDRSPAYRGIVNLERGRIRRMRRELSYQKLIQRY